MKKILLTVAVLAGSMSIAHAHTHNFESYSELRGNAGQFKVDSDVTAFAGDLLATSEGKKAPVGGLTVRHHYNERLAAEIDFAIAGDAETFGRESVNVNTAVFAAAILKADQVQGFMPYAKLGYGLFDLTLEYDGESVEDKHATYVAGLGIDYELTPKAVIGVQFEYYGGFDVEYSDDGYQQSLDMTRTSVNVGFRF